MPCAIHQTALRWFDRRGAERRTLVAGVSARYSTSPGRSGGVRKGPHLPCDVPARAREHDAGYGNPALAAVRAAHVRRARLRGAASHHRMWRAAALGCGGGELGRVPPA